jgi:chromosome segregation ATPase
VPALRKREAELTSAQRRVQRLASTVRSAFAAGAGALGDESVLRGDMSMSFAAGADESTIFATPGGRASSRSFETDLFDEIDQVKQHIEDASRRMDFQRVETEMQLRRARTEMQANAARAETASVPTQDSGDVSVESAGTEMPRQRSVTPESEPLPDLATELAAKRAQLESLQARRAAAALSQASAAATVEYVAKLEARVAAHQAEIRDYLQCAADGAAHLVTYRRRISELEMHLSLAAASSSQGGEGSEALAKVIRQKSDVETQLADSRARIKRREEQIGQHQQEIAGLRTQLQAATAEAQTLRTNVLTAQDAAEELNDEKAALDRQALELTAAVHEAESARVAAQTQAADAVASLKSATASEASLQSQLEAQATEVARLEEQLSQAEAQANDVRARTSSDTAADEALFADLAAKTRAHAALTAELAAAREEQISLQEQLNDVAAEKEQLSAASAKLNEDLADALTRLDGAIEAESAASLKVIELQERLDALAEEHAASRAAAALLQEQLEAAQLDAKTQAAEVVALTEQLASLRENAAASELQVSSLEQRVLKAESNLAAAGGDEEAHNAALDSLRAELATAAQAAQDLHAGAVAVLEERLAAATQAAADSAEQLSALQAEAEQVQSLREEVQQLSLRLSETVAERDAAIAASNNVSTSASAAEDAWRAERATLSASLQDAEARLADLAQSGALLAEREEQVAALELALRERDVQIKQRNDEYWDLKEELGTLQEEVERAQDEQAAVSDLESRLAEAKQASDSLALAKEAAEQQLVEERSRLARDAAAHSEALAQAQDQAARAESEIQTS